MFNNAVRVMLAVLVLAIGTPAAHGAACVSAGYAVGFFNGVWNDYEEATKAMKRLQQVTGSVINGKDVTFEVFYNSTAYGAGATSLQDLAEVFQQRAAEIDASGALGQRFEFLADTLTGRHSFADSLRAIVPNIAGLLDSVYSIITAKIVSQLATIVSRPPTLEDYAYHGQQLISFEFAHRMILLVAHSQGNLFVNKAYDNITGFVGGTTPSIQVVHVAPASPTLRGDYVLADIDIVINGLRLFGITSVKDNNISLPTSTADVSGHEFIPTYMDPGREANFRIQTMIVTAISRLQPDFRYQPGGGGLCQF